MRARGDGSRLGADGGGRRRRQSPFSRSSKAAIDCVGGSEEMSYPHLRSFSSRTAVTQGGERRGRALEKRGGQTGRRGGSPITGIPWVANEGERGCSTPSDYTGECRRNHFAPKISALYGSSPKHVFHVFYLPRPYSTLRGSRRKVPPRILIVSIDFKLQSLAKCSLNEPFVSLL